MKQPATLVDLVAAIIVAEEIPHSHILAESFSVVLDRMKRVQTQYPHLVKDATRLRTKAGKVNMAQLVHLMRVELGLYDSREDMDRAARAANGRGPDA